MLGANYEGLGQRTARADHPGPASLVSNPVGAVHLWFLALSMVAALFYFVSRNRFQRRLRQLQMEQEVQLEKQRLSRDLHDNPGLTAYLAFRNDLPVADRCRAGTAG